jgi:lipopolysaccharide/colanic/teichoic acid biosynthesis glycosyltransferase
MSSKGEATVMDKSTAQVAMPTVRESIVKERYKREAPVRNFSRPKFESLQEKTYTGKRFIDVMLGGIGFILFTILAPCIALGIKLSSRGPVIFKQERTGQHGEKFICYKFRTMHQLKMKRLDGKPVVTQKGDKRIFWFGSMLRKTNLDELPQIINVLKGDMSLVGPRPYPVDECKHWNNTFDDFYFRYAVKPGISGYAQVTGYRGGTLDEGHMRARLDKDLVYVQKQSLFFDLNIIYRTVKQMLHLDTNAH